MARAHLHCRICAGESHSTRGNGFVIGENGGSESVTLTVPQLPIHSHVPLGVSSAGNQASPAGNIFGQSATINPYSSVPAAVPMNAAAVGPAGGSQPHDNMMPYLTVSFIISLFGIFPSQ